jgi:uncharacterized protein YdeI (YjbR/CyaY-like superfamily)
MFTMNPARMRHAVAIGSEMTAELAPEGPQRSDLANDIAAALAAGPTASAFFDGLTQFYRKAYRRYIGATTRTRSARAGILEVVDPPRDRINERPRS